MAGNDLDILSIDRGLITAPAGCGKTHLIADALARHIDIKPILVLTHTNAGVTALRGRLNHAGVSSNAYRISTIDGWSMRLISTFPARSNYDLDILKLANPGFDYPNIRVVAAKLIMSGHVKDILTSSYARLIVDEYQDCSIRQHQVVTSIAQILPTCVLGDPMQAIFGFGSDVLADWNKEICAFFPLIGELSTPWRWINSNSEPLGNWLLGVRKNLLCGEPINLKEAPSSVSWVELNGTDDYQKRLIAAQVQPPDGNSRILIIGDSINRASQHKFASQTPGAITVEAVDLRDLVSFARTFDLAVADALERLVQFAHSVMINVGAEELLRRIQSISQGTAHKPPTEVERAALAFIHTPSYRASVAMLSEISKGNGVRAYRPAVLRACIKALQLCGGSDNLSFYDAAIQVREQNRYYGRSLPKRGVGSTLLLKGLEAEVVVVLNADVLDARNLYVAMTRGSKALIICSHSPVLNPKK